MTGLVQISLEDTMPWFLSLPIIIRDFKQGYPVERLKSSFRQFYGVHGDLIQQYAVSLSQMLMIVWSLTSYSDFPTDKTFHKFHDLDTKLDLQRITNAFHGFNCNGCSMPAVKAYPRRYLVPSTRFVDLLVHEMLRLVFQKLPCLEFYLDYPSVLSRFYLVDECINLDCDQFCTADVIDTRCICMEGFVLVRGTCIGKHMFIKIHHI